MARQYKRDKNGRFASSNNATTTTTGRAGGFANQQFRTKVQTARANQQATNSKSAPVSSKSGQVGKNVRRAAVGTAAATVLRSPRVRARIVQSVAVPAVATAIGLGLRTGRAGRLLGTRRGRDSIQLAQNRRNLSNLLKQQTFDKNLRGRTRAIVARPTGGGSKSGRPTYRYAKSTLRPQSARLRLSNTKRALSGRI